MGFSDYIAITALLISLGSLVTSFYFGFRDRGKILASCFYYRITAEAPHIHVSGQNISMLDDHPNLKFMPGGVELNIVNSGRRVLIMGQMCIRYEDFKNGSYVIECTPLGSKDRGLMLEENERHTEYIEIDDELVSKLRDNVVTGFWIEDTSQKKHSVRNGIESFTQLRNELVIRDFKINGKNGVSP